MKCVVGVDYEGRSASAIAWLGRLQFPMERTILLNVAAPLAVTMGPSAYGMIVECQELIENLDKAGTKALKDAYDEAVELKLRPETMKREGSAPGLLEECAEDAGAELIAVTSTVKGSLDAIVGGSVARRLAISAKQSLLVTREELPTDGPLRVVFATDQSAYCDECIRLLAQLSPKGISHMTLLSIRDTKHYLDLFESIEHAKVKPLLEKELVGMTQKGEADAQWLSSVGIATSSRVIAGDVNESIRKVMQETEADLLIVGSQGHSFLERIATGSTCLHEVVSEHYAVLLLRPAFVLAATPDRATVGPGVHARP